jgi:Fe-S-cluster containining protein
MTECSCCGDCCDPVWFPLGPADIRQGSVTATSAPHAANLSFATRHWSATGARDEDGRHAYRCDAFDVVSRRCTAHDERPPICRGYPWYESGPDAHSPRLPERCAFRADVGLPVLELLPRPPAEITGRTTE